MVHDSIRKAGVGDPVTDEAWMKELKGAAASAFLGELLVPLLLFICCIKSFTSCFRRCRDSEW